MKKIIHGLLAVAAAASTQVLEASATNKTFQADRGTLSNNILMSNPAARVWNKGKKDSIGANVSALGFVRQTYSDSNGAKYFGTGSSLAPDAAITVTAASAVGTPTTTGLYNYQIDPSHNGSSVSMSGVAGLNPRRTEAGAQLAWTQSLSKFVKGLSFAVEVPVVYVRTEMRASYANEVASTAGSGQNISAFFSGAALGKTGTPVAATPVVQANLDAQVISTGYNTKTGVADVAVTLGYRFVKEKSYSIGGSIYGLIPTGNKATGTVAFEPMYGHRSFFVGAGLDGRFNLWKSEDNTSALDFSALARYSYGFSAADVRTLGLYSVANGNVPAGQYYFAGSVGNQSGAPLANLSTLAVNVQPRSRLEAVANFCYRYNRFNAGIAYNFFYAQKENVTFAGTWNEAAYVVPNDNTQTYTTPFAVSNTVAAGNGALILAPGDLSGSYALNLDTCTTPSQVIHKVGGHVGYRFDTSLPVYASVGGEVDFTGNNHANSTWAAFAKLGFSF